MVHQVGRLNCTIAPVQHLHRTHACLPTGLPACRFEVWPYLERFTLEAQAVLSRFLAGPCDAGSLPSEYPGLSPASAAAAKSEAYNCPPSPGPRYAAAASSFTSADAAAGSAAGGASGMVGDGAPSPAPYCAPRVGLPADVDGEGVGGPAGPKPDVIIGNYSDGGLVAALLAGRLGVTHCHIAHALEKTKYGDADLHW